MTKAGLPVKGGMGVLTYRNIEKKESNSQTCKMAAMTFIATVKVVMKAYTICLNMYQEAIN